MPKPWWETDFDPMQHLIKAEHDIHQLDQNILALVQAHNSLAQALEQQAGLIRDLAENNQKLSKLVVELTQNQETKNIDDLFKP